MSTMEIIDLVNRYNEWSDLLAEAQEEVEALKDAIKREMTNRNTEELEAGEHIVRWTPVTSNRFDSATFKKALPDVYKAYMKQTTSRRFTVSRL